MVFFDFMSLLTMPEDYGYDLIYGHLIWPTVIAITIVVTRFAYQHFRAACSLPPGPWGVPHLGYKPFFPNTCTYLKYNELAREYGPIVSLTQRGNTVVLLSDHQLIKKAFDMKQMTGRHDDGYMDIIGGYGAVNSTGKLWEEQRKFLHTILRHMGMTFTGHNRLSMESRIMIEVSTLMEKYNTSCDVSIDLNVGPLCLAITNVISSLTMSVRFEQNDPKFVRYTHMVEEGFKLFGMLRPVNVFSPLHHILEEQGIQEKIKSNHKEITEYFKSIIEEHRKTFDPNQLRDMVDAYLLEVIHHRESGKADILFQNLDPDRQISQVLGDLFSAGTETIKNSILWSMVYMLHYPHVMVKVQEELDSIVGRYKTPMLEDYSKLPYTQATLFEVLRKSSITPLGTTHSTTSEVILDGYRIPAGAQIIPLQHFVHNDPKLWDEPELFKPERFITTDGKVKKPDGFLPFGVGRRKCLGETLAQIEMYLFFASILQEFTICLPEGDKLPSMDGQIGVTLTPNPFKVVFKKRVPNM